MGDSGHRLRCPSAVDGLRWPSLHLRPSRCLRRHRGAAGLQCVVGQRSHGVLSPLARRPDRARRHDRALGRHDARNDRRTSHRSRTSTTGQVARGHRSALRRTRRRRGRPRLVREGLRQRRPRLRRAMGPPRRIDRRAPGPVATRQPALRRPLLLDRGDEPRSASRASGRTTDLDRKLGIGCRASPHGPAGRRLARVGLQHDAVSVRRGVGSTARPPPCRGQGPRALSQCVGDHVVPHHRGQGGGRPGHAGTIGTDHQPPRGRPS